MRILTSTSVPFRTMPNLALIEAKGINDYCIPELPPLPPNSSPSKKKIPRFYTRELGSSIPVPLNSESTLEFSIFHRLTLSPFLKNSAWKYAAFTLLDCASDW